jgi:hypothetical protein
MFKHKNLVGNQILNLASEHRLSNDAYAITEEIVRTITSKMCSGPDVGRKLRGHELKDIVETPRRNIVDRSILLQHESASKRATLGRPNSDVYDDFYLYVYSASETDMLPMTMRVIGSRAQIELEFSTPPVAFTYHAAERLLEREGEKERAIRSISASLLDMYPFLKIVEELVAKNLHSEMLVPDIDGHGVFLGSLYQTHARPLRFIIRREGMQRLRMESLWPLGLEFVAHTFVDNSRLRPAQIRFADAIRAWRARNLEANRVLKKFSLWVSDYENEISMPSDEDLARARIEALALVGSDDAAEATRRVRKGSVQASNAA